MKKTILVIGAACSMLISALAFASSTFDVVYGDCADIATVEAPYSLPALDVAVESAAKLQVAEVNDVSLLMEKRRHAEQSALIVKLQTPERLLPYEVGWRNAA